MPLLQYKTITEKEDLLLNERMLTMLAYGTLGLGLAGAVSLFFRKKMRILALGTGFGAGMSHDYFEGNLFHFKYHKIHGYHH